MYSKWMLLLYSCYKSMIHTVHTIIYRCMLHLLLIGDASQEYYRAMMHHRHNKDEGSICYWFIMHLTTASIKHVVNMRLQMSFYQHFVTAQARSAIGLKLSMWFAYKEYVICMLLTVKLLTYATFSPWHRSIRHLRPAIDLACLF